MATLNCPHCHQPAEYEVTWVVRTKKRQLAGRADERDRARFAKARSYMLRKDDLMACKNMRCRKRFEISGCSRWCSPSRRRTQHSSCTSAICAMSTRPTAHLY